eukprot:COSAG01_NODE_55821_length_322_cov_1.165919_1_plen_53_part_10
MVIVFGLFSSSEIAAYQDCSNPTSVFVQLTQASSEVPESQVEDSFAKMRQRVL